MSVKPWVAAIHRLLKAELRPDPRPKPGTKPERIYWNGQDLSAAASLRPNTVSDTMTGKRDPSIETLTAIAAALGVPVSVLFMETDEAEAYARFKQNQVATQTRADLETSVRDVLREAFEPYADKLTQTVLAKVTGQPAPQPAVPAASALEHDPPAEHPARGRLQRPHKQRRTA